MIARGEISPVELTSLYLERLRALDPILGAFITVCEESALEEARRAEAEIGRGDPLPPLHGVPIAVKDLELTQGIRSTLGSPALQDYVPDRDSVVVERIRQSGAIIVGKTSTPEIGISFATVTDNPISGPCRNPWDPARTTGGSSGGSAAAIAAGLCSTSLGSDGGGSIRIPASFCGVFGFKPSHGRVPRANGFGQPEPNQFAQSGPITRSVRDGAVLMNILAGPDPRDPTPECRETPPDFTAQLEEDVAGLRVGWVTDVGFGALEPRVCTVVRSAVELFDSGGSHVDEIRLTLPGDLSEHFWNIFASNAYAAFGELLEATPMRLGEDGRAALERGRAVSGAEYARSLRVVNEIRRYLSQVMDRYDLLMTPTTSIPAFEPDHRPKEIGGKPVDSVTGFYPYTFPFNMTGQPAASVPCGFVDALPIGVHIVGRKGDDALVLRAAATFERASPWIDCRPAILEGESDAIRQEPASRG